MTWWGQTADKALTSKLVCIELLVQLLMVLIAALMCDWTNFLSNTNIKVQSSLSRFFFHAGLVK